MSLPVHAVAALAIFLGFHLVHYVAHRWLVHRILVHVFYEAHALGHHRVYTAAKYVSPEFLGFNKTLLADWFLGSTLLGLSYLALPLELFLQVLLEGLALAALIA